MIIRKQYAWVLTLIVLALILTACNGTAATEDPAAAIDPNQIYTQAAETVSAQLTAAAPAATEAPAALPPTYTPIPQEAAALPTFTLAVPTVDPGAADGAAPTQVVLPQQPAAAVPTALPTAAAAAAADKLEDKARFLFQSPGDGFEFNPGGKFDATFAFENIGDTTWNSLYSIRRYQGETFGLGSSKFTFDDFADNQTVEKGEVVNIVLRGLQAPLGAGAYDSFWCLYNNREDEGKSPQCFYLFYVNIIVK